jgi:hypothetical protein
MLPIDSRFHYPKTIFMKRNLLFFTVAVCVLFFASCKKGDDGPPGTANVRYSAWFTASPWKKDTIFGIYGFNYIKAAPDITQNILDSGVVLTFGKLLGYNQLVWPAGQVAQLPINLTYIQGQTVTDTWSGSATLGNIKIRFVNDNNIYNVIATNHQFRYVIIPGGVAATTGRSSLTSLSYEEICRRYNIPE